MNRKFLCLLLALLLLLSVCLPAGAEDSLFFVAVDDTVPMTLTTAPFYSGSTLYVASEAFETMPGDVLPSYNMRQLTYVLFTSEKRLVFDLLAGTVTDENNAVSEVKTIYRNGVLYLPLYFCTSHFGLRASMLESAQGYPVLRFCTGNEVYDNALFIEKAENLISYRVSQYLSGASGDGENPAQPGANPQSPSSEPPSQSASTVYLAFTGAEFMEDAAQALKDYQLRGAFFLTRREILDHPSLVRALYAAGHRIGLSVPEDCQDVPGELAQANEALSDALNFKTLLALLPAGSEAVSGYCVFCQPALPLSAQAAAQSVDAAQLLVLSDGAASALQTLFEAGASVLQLRETTPYFHPPEADG